MSNRALRAVEAHDLATIAGWRSDRSLRNLTHGFRFPVSGEAERKWFEDSVLHGAPRKAIFAIQAGDGAAAGIAQLADIDPIHRHARLGIYLAGASARGQGLGSRAMSELLAFGFDDLNLNRIYLEVTATNEAAIALYRKHGFADEGTLRQHYFVDGAMQDVTVMALLAGDYRAGR